MNDMRGITSSLLWGLLCLVGCTTSTRPSRSVEVPIEGADFRAPTVVRFSVRNETENVVFVSRCGDHVLPSIERLHAGTWENAAAAICPANLLTVAAELRPGDALSDSVGISEPGEYRLVVSYGAGVLRILYSAPSAPFVVH